MKSRSINRRNQIIGPRGIATMDNLTIRARANVSIKFAADAPRATIAKSDVASAAILCCFHGKSQFK